MSKLKTPKDYPLVGVRPPPDVDELVKCAKRDHFAKSAPAIYVRCTRLFLMPIYGHKKRVQAALQEMLKQT